MSGDKCSIRADYRGGVNQVTSGRLTVCIQWILDQGHTVNNRGSPLQNTVASSINIVTCSIGKTGDQEVGTILAVLVIEIIRRNRQICSSQSEGGLRDQEGSICGDDLAIQADCGLDGAGREITDHHIGQSRQIRTWSRRDFHILIIVRTGLVNPNLTENRSPGVSRARHIEDLKLSGIRGHSGRNRSDNAARASIIPNPYMSRSTSSSQSIDL